MVEVINNKLTKTGTIMMVHCTCFSDDRQVMQYMRYISNRKLFDKWQWKMKKENKTTFILYIIALVCFFISTIFVFIDKSGIIF